MDFGTMNPLLLVLGATGEVGRAVVATALAEGRGVVAVARGLEGLESLRLAHPGADLSVLRGSVATDRQSAQLLRRVRRLRRPLSGVVVALCGGCVRERLLDSPMVALKKVIDSNLLAHASAARHLLPMLAEGTGGYVLVSGPGGEHPWAGHGPRSLVAAGLRMLARVLHEEARALPVRVQLLAIDSPLCTERNRAQACPHWPQSHSVAQRVLQLVDGEPHSTVPAVVRFESTRRAPPPTPKPPPPALEQQVWSWLNSVAASPSTQGTSP